MIEINGKSEYEKILNENEYVIIKFYTTWCGPCKLLNPQYENASMKCSNVKFVAIDAEKNSEISSEFNIHTVPTVILFKNKKVKSKFEGFKTSDFIVNFINENV